MCKQQQTFFLLWDFTLYTRPVCICTYFCHFFTFTISKKQQKTKQSTLEALEEIQWISDVEVHDFSGSTDEEYDSEEDEYVLMNMNPVYE